MNLISYSFLIFILFAVSAYYFLPVKARPFFLLLCGFVFYLWGSPVLVFYPVADVLLTFLFGTVLSKEHINRKLILILGIIPVLGLLLVTKYLPYGFSLLDINNISIAVPLGISYFTLESIGYLVDVYHNPSKKKSLIQLFEFFFFFPKILSGPICKTDNLIQQINQANTATSRELSFGLTRMLTGLFKKTVLADNLSRFVDTAYSSPSSTPGPALIICAVLYSLQLYFDFTGCMDIVIGAAKCFGITLPENFKTPYFSTSIKEFWSRWHITLSNWYRDYIYFPLGGSRKGISKSLINITIVFILSGLWHGAGITFILWGLWHGIFRCLETVFNKFRKKTIHSESDPVSLMCKRIGVFIVVTFGWILFRSNSLSVFYQYVKFIPYNWNITVLREWISTCINSVFNGSALYGKFIIVLVFVSLGIATALDILQYKSEKNGSEISNPLMLLSKPVKITVIILIVVLILISGNFGSSGFIYYKFD